jgi:hypothetical protein
LLEVEGRALEEDAVESREGGSSEVEAEVVKVDVTELSRSSP